MAISIPVISDFNSKGIDSAIREFKKLETAGEKAQFAIKKAAVPAGLAIAGLAIAGADAVKAFMEDDKAAQLLATSLRNTTGATDAQVASVESFITKTSIAAAVADDELRPALDKLVRGTGDVAKAQDLLGLALDISAGTGKDLGAVSDALSKAFNGQLGPLKKLDPALASLIENGATTDEVFAALGETFKGQASTSANTASGKMKSFSIQMGEFKESIGAAILPIVEKLLPAFQAMGTWISNNVPLVVTLGAVIGGIAAAVVLTNAAMAAWNALTIITAAVNAILATSFSALWVATGAVIILGIIAALIALQMKFDIFGIAIDAIKIGFDKLWGAIKFVFDWVKNNWPLLLAVLTGPFGWALAFVMKFKDDIWHFLGVMKTGIGTIMGGVADVIFGPFKTAFNAIAKLWNNTVGKLSFTVPSWVPGIGGKGFDVPDIPMLAEGGIVNSATLAMIGESGPEAVIPLSKLGSMGGGSNITVNVTSANPDDVVAALQRWVRNNGSLALATTAGVRF
jgi:hypothetical protein